MTLEPLLVAVALAGPQGDAKLANPIVRGMAPDPSVVRVGDDVYLVNSSFEYFPGVPIRRSRDLSNWELIGHCLTTDDQLPLAGQRSSGGIYAPTLRYHDGLFYMITTNVGGGGNFLVTAKDPRGPWSKRVMVGVSSIDPSLFWDRDGVCYLTVQGTEGVRQAEFDPLTGKLRSELKVVWKGTGGQWPEGPHLFRRGDYYYLTIAEGGTEYGHMQTLARSRSPWGPFEGCPRNPILTHRSLNSPFQAIGHADFFDDAQGRWWAVCLGIRPQGYPYGHNLGRETLIVPVRWGDDGWPVVGDDGRVPKTVDLPAAKDALAAALTDFPGGKVPLEWSYLRNPDRSKYLAAPGGGLRLVGSKFTLGDVASPTWIGRPQAHLHATLVLDVDASGIGEGEGGLSLRMNETHRIELFARRGEVGLRTTIGPLSVVTKTEKYVGGSLRLELAVRPDHYEFTAEIAGKRFPLGSVPSHYFSTEVAGGFTGVMLGAYVTGEGAVLDVRRAAYDPTGE